MKSEWTYRPLGELVSFASGGTPSKKRDDYWGGTIPWISAKTLKTENIDTSDLFITEEGLKAGSKIAPKGSILLLTRGSGLFNGIPIARVEKDVAFNQDIKCLDSYGEVENEFIFYWLLSQKDYLMAKVGVTGIGAGKFDLDFLQKLMIPIPSERERKSIVGFASSISEKIRCNAKVNDNLLWQAQALYKDRFIDLKPFNGKMPPDWQLGTVSEIIELHDSKRIPLSSRERANLTKIYPYYGATSVMDYVDRYLFDGIYLLLGEDGTVVDDKGFPILQYVEGKFWVNNHAHIITGKNGFTVETLYLLFSLTNVRSIVTGAVQPKISQANLNNVSVVIPSKAELSTFNSIVQPIFSQIRNLRAESDRLTSTITIYLEPDMAASHIPFQLVPKLQ
ncbi:MAG: restriction endonuclease subunit S [Faecalibacterium sp.]